MVRSLHDQMQADAKRVFLNLNEHAHKERIRYHRNAKVPPDDLYIPIIDESDENMNSVWNKNKAQQRAGNEPILFQMERVIWCALEDFQPPPKKNHTIVIGNIRYNVLSVSTEDGMLKIEVRTLEE